MLLLWLTANREGLILSILSVLAITAVFVRFSTIGLRACFKLHLATQAHRRAT